MNIIPKGTQFIHHSKDGGENYYKQENGALMHWSNEVWKISCIPELKVMQENGFKLTYIN
ncbi:hypothetical protein AAV96_00085 [Acinetobacter sp. AG1]|uniref:hypothetical protein n=1 Tax=Acinetobacter TaxID=469 RepID=UPI000629A9A2|nr:hypothetical protein [Acinetobacter sp. AG1]KKW82429.1 hypothetical protein AAV96_00125 [Acinetobacter sp. AG1]KKW82440.1 hypothetical protein AAV96_00085 [Acinetobacter sp. AG1]